MKRKQRQIIAMITLLTMLFSLITGCGASLTDLPEVSTQSPAEDTTEAYGEMTEGISTTEPSETENVEIAEKIVVEPIEPFVVPEFAPVTRVTEAIVAQYDEAWPFSEGYAVVGIKQGDVMKYNYINTDGQLLLAEWVDIARSFSEGLACVGVDAGIGAGQYGMKFYRFGYVDTNGEVAIPMEILSYETHYPRAFYNGYAEILYVDPEGEEMKVDYQGVVVRNNVIDRKGNNLFEADLMYLSAMYPYGYDRSRDRVLPIEKEWDELDYCMHNEWMRNRVNGETDDSYVWNQLDRVTYLVDAEGKIKETLPGLLYELGENYYCLSAQDGNCHKLYDKDFNLISREEHLGFQEGVGGQVVVSIREKDINGALKTWEQVFDADMNPVSGLYNMIRTAGDRYMGINYYSANKYEIFDTEGRMIRQITENPDTLQYFRDGYYDENGYRLAGDGFFIGTKRNGSDYQNQTMYYYNSDGKLIHWGTNATCRQVNEGLYCVGTEGGTGRLIDREFKTHLNLPKADMINYAGNAENIYLCCYEGDVVYWYHLSNADGIWKIAEEGTEATATFNRSVRGWRFTVGENENSQIISETKYDGPAVLEWKDGSELDEGNAISLVSDGLYLIAEYQDYVATYGYEARGYSLNFGGRAVSEVYEALDVFSEGYIAFSEEGKWGYLKVERGDE